MSYFDALRFANWLHNGQGSGDTETGAYTLLGGTPTPNNPMVERNTAATVFLPTDAEWYKAAYYDTHFGAYYDYPAGTDTLIVGSAPTATPNRANCGGAAGGSTDVGSYTGSSSPSGTFDQRGNVAEWTDMWAGILENRTIRGGSLGSSADLLGGRKHEYDDPWFESGGIGFRVATLAEDAGGSECGISICESTENALTCPGDCPGNCGDALCSGDENAQSCSVDCPHSCGDGVCTGFESTATCWGDCGFCGDDVCDPSENPSSCAADCTPVCGNGASCTSLGFGGGALTCNASTCTYATSGCVSCKPRFASCTQNGQCCSGNCRFRRCR